MNKTARIVAVTSGGPHAWTVLNALGDAFGPLTVLLEQPEGKAAFLKRRARKIGWVQTGGQFLTMVWSRFGKAFATRRMAEIASEHGLKLTPNPHHTIIPVDSINGTNALEALTQAQPGVVFLVSCRMLAKPTLAAIPCPVINYHAGVNPMYRGLNGGYFALARGDAGNFGSTVHLVDAGVDTGATLAITRIADASKDTILTYPLLMAAHSRTACVAAVRDALDGNLKPVAASGPSAQHFHPPIWAYLWTGLTRGIW